MVLLQRFQSFIKEQHLFQHADKLLVAVSGGLDSVVLCELCKRSGYDFAIAHCNFKLRGEESDRDEAFVKALAEKYAVEFYSTVFDTKEEAKKNKIAIEETARNLRYDWFLKLMKENSFDYVLTAHHADDNIETVLMNFFRGTGMKGLRGIQPKQNKIIRPLLFATRKEIEDFAEENATAFVIDSSNAENDFTRNYFRNQLIPDIAKVYPNVKQNILNNINRFSEAEKIYDRSITEIKEKLMERKGSDIHIPVLKLLKTDPLGTVLHEIIAEFGFTAAQTNEVKKLLDAESGKYVSSVSHRILKNRNWLIISPLQQGNEAEFILIEKGDTEVNFPAGQISLKQITQSADLKATPETAMIDASVLKYPLYVRKWKTGDYFYPLGMKKKKKLSRFFSDLKLSLIDKENVWLIESDKKIVWIINRRIDDRFKITDKTKEILQLSFE